MSAAKPIKRRSPLMQHVLDAKPKPGELGDCMACGAVATRAVPSAVLGPETPAPCCDSVDCEAALGGAL